MYTDYLQNLSTEELIQKFDAYCKSPENLNRKKYWIENDDNLFPIERWRGRAAQKTNTVCTMSMDISGYSPLLGINCGKYYKDPENNLREQLRYTLWDTENIALGRYFEPTVFCSLASVFEAALYGQKVHFPEEQAPWFDESDHLIKEKSDLLKLKPFDFETSGLIPVCREMYEHHKEAVKGTDLKPVFPFLVRSPFSTAIMLRGFEELLIDSIEDPEFFTELMTYITDTEIEFTKKRAEYLGEPVYYPGMLGNDEIATPIVSPTMYNELIYPHEKRLAEFWGGIRYWHSCGKTDPFYEKIATLDKLEMMHIGPWSDIPSAVEVFGPKDISIEICMNSNRDLFDKDYDQMVADLERIKSICEGKIRYQIRMDGIAIFKNQEFTMQKVKEWVKAANQVFPVQ